MAIQKINLGTEPLGEGGDTNRSANTKINENFSNTDHAASKLVGTATGRIPLAEDINRLAFIGNTRTSISSDTEITTMADIPAGGSHYIGGSPKYSDAPQVFSYGNLIRFDSYGSSGFTILHGYGSHSKYMLYMRSNKSLDGWMKIYHDKNTKLDTNGAIAPSSPTIDLYSDHIETNEDGARMNPEFIRNGVGDYTIKNTTGLRDEGWYIKIPNDMNGNPKVAVAIETDKDGNLNIKTYKRTFSLETFTFGPDLSEPLDIPEGRWIDLRFNDLPEEQLEEPEPSEESK